MTTAAQTSAWPNTREDIGHHIANVWTLEQYLAFMNRDVAPGEGGLHTDLGAWAQDGIVTAAQLADMLDGACARNVEKSEMSAYAEPSSDEQDAASRWTKRIESAKSISPEESDRILLLVQCDLEPGPITLEDPSYAVALCEAARDDDDADHGGISFAQVAAAAREVPIIGFDRVRFDYGLDGVLTENEFDAPATIGGLVDLFMERIIPQESYFEWHQMPIREAKADGTTLVIGFSLGDG